MECYRGRLQISFYGHFWGSMYAWVFESKLLKPQTPSVLALGFRCMLPSAASAGRTITARAPDAIPVTKRSEIPCQMTCPVCQRNNSNNNSNKKRSNMNNNSNNDNNINNNSNKNNNSNRALSPTLTAQLLMLNGLLANPEPRTSTPPPSDTSTFTSMSRI